MAVALFDPEPVAEGNAGTQCQCAPSGDVPRWRKEEEVDGEEDGREEVEGEIGHEGQLRPFGEDEVLVDLDIPDRLALFLAVIFRSQERRMNMGAYRSYAPVQDGNEHFEGRRASRKSVLGAK